MNGSTTTTVGGVTVPMRNGNGKAARTEEWSAKRMSRSFDLDDGMDDLDGSFLPIFYLLQVLKRCISSIFIVKF